MNFARRQECNKCGAPKPGDAGFGGTRVLVSSLSFSSVSIRQPYSDSIPVLKIAEAEGVSAGTVAVASGVVEDSVAETVVATEEAVVAGDLEVATKWEEG